MIIRVLLAAVLSAVLMFLWGAVYWMVLGGAERTQAPLPPESQKAIVNAMKSSGMETGMYMHPFPVNDSDEEATMRADADHLNGPLFQLAYHKEGAPVMDPKLMGMGLAHMALVALVAASLTALVAKSLPTLPRRFAFVLLLAVMASVWANLGDVIWWRHPLHYAAGNMLYQVIAGALMAAVIALLVKPRDDAATAE